MLFKYTLKNIFAKKGRLIIITICMVAACFTAFLAADMGSSVSEILMKMIMRDYGTTDFVITYTGTGGISDDFFDGLPDSKHVCKGTLYRREVRRDVKQYDIALTENLQVAAYSDWNDAIGMRLLKADAVPQAGHVTVNRAYSDKFGCKEGDTLILYDSDGEEYPFTVGKVFEDSGETYNGFITMEDYCRVSKRTVLYTTYVDVDDKIREEYRVALLEKYPAASVTKAYAAEAMKDLMDQMKMMLYLMFVLMFLLVVFVTVSFTERIINERMSVIGTLRSIGVSMRKTAFILLFENIMYALIGCFIAFFAYFALRTLLFNYMEATGQAAGTGPMKPVTVLAVVAGAVFVQVLIPALEMLKAVKTSIRDIIFDTKDSEYKLSYPRTIFGMAMIIIGLIIGFALRNMVVTMAGLILVVAGVALVLPICLRTVTKWLKKLFAKAKMPVAELAATEAGSKKHNFGSAVLAVASILVTSVVFVASNSMLLAVQDSLYDADVIVSGGEMRTSKYDFIKETEGVESVDYIYYQASFFSVIGYGDGKEDGFDLYAFSNPDLYKGMGDLGPALGKNEMILNASAANRLGVKEGDTVKLIFHINDVFPMERELTVKKITKKSPLFSMATIVLSVDMYKELHADTPDTLLIKTDSPEKVKAELKDNLTGAETVKTNEELVAEQMKSNMVTVFVLYGAILASIALTLIGISGNQVIAFASRKKEYAMLHSTACPLKKIIRLIRLENGIVFGIAGLMAFIMTLPVVKLTERVFVLSNMNMEMHVNYGLLFLFIVVLWGITMLTTISPIKSLKKMNTATEMKYE